MNVLNPKKGFTLIELMVAISIFTIVALIVSSTVVILMNSFRRAQDLKLILDNLNFAMQNMTFNIKEGTSYDFDTTDQQAGWFSFKENESQAVGSGCEDSENFITYELCQGAIYRYCGPHQSSFSCADGNAIGDRVTSNEITIESLRFLGNASGQSGSEGPGRVTLLIKGKALPSRYSPSEFTIQTTVSQRQTQ